MAAVRATYRVQLSGDFDLDAAAGLASYLDSLGISHIYASPFLAARSGSPHGYDIIDHNRINPELGGADAFERMHGALRERRMGCILDFVPNHMGVGRADNPWWLDVLEWGRISPYAEYFDIDWDPAKRELRGKVLLPFLGASYGEELEAGALRLAADFEQGTLSVHYHEHRFPIGPRQYETVLGSALPWLPDGPDRTALEELRAGFRALPRGGVPKARRQDARRRAAELKRRLAETVAARPAVANAIGSTIESINGTPGRPRSFAALHRLLEAQAYRLSFWRVAADEINYRRFFDINELAALRVERRELFDVIHRLVFRLIDEGKLDGLRIDHIDGLFDPQEYCDRMAGRLHSAKGGRQPYLVVEKILGANEELRESWPVDGTTGYEFANQVLGLFVDPEGHRSLDALYRRFAGAEAGFDEVRRASRKHVLQHLLASELQVLANRLDRIAEQTWRTRDFTFNTLRDTLSEVIACLPIYRTYIAGRAAGQDRARIETAVRRARQGSATPSQVFDFLSAALMAEFGRTSRRPGLRRRVVDFAMRTQQLTSAVAAKGEEDTAFYRYARFVALNEVGGDPDIFGWPPKAFHRSNTLRARRWPRSMLATATHDAKRGEDVRARLAVLSEMPTEWRRAVLGWARANQRARVALDEGPAPTRNDEYLLYQTLVGSWPLELSGYDATGDAALGAYRVRIRDYMTKAVREAKLRSSWAEPNHEYENAVSGFVDRVLDTGRGRAFLTRFLPFQERVARLGMINGLAQTVLKHGAPGVADTYQGSELWDLSLVDPDNRRPVDFAHRAELLRGLRAQFPHPFDPSNAEGARTLLSEWRDGRIKLYLTWRLLELRRTRPELFEGAYRPLESWGPAATHLCAFAREADDGSGMAIFAVPRLIAGLAGVSGGEVTGSRPWNDTVLRCPDALAGRTARSILTGASLSIGKGLGTEDLPAAELFADLPIATLVVD